VIGVASTSATIRFFLRAGIAVAAAGFSGQAAAQVSTAGTAEIVEPGGVNLLQNGSTARLSAVGEVTFALSTQVNGSIAVQLPGFVTQSSEGRKTLLGHEGGEAITGTTMTSQALSLSFSGGAMNGGGQADRQSASNVTLLLANYN
jgi:hypothetical protein